MKFARHCPRVKLCFSDGKALKCIEVKLLIASGETLHCLKWKPPVAKVKLHCQVKLFTV